MYIALISLHALIMVGFHFLHCFEEDWTSEYCLGGFVTERGGLSVSVRESRANLVLLEILQAFGLAREGSTEAATSPHEKQQPLKVRSTGKAVSWPCPLAPCEGRRSLRAPEGVVALPRGELLFPCS